MKQEKLSVQNRLVELHVQGLHLGHHMYLLNNCVLIRVALNTVRSNRCLRVLGTTECICVFMTSGLLELKLS